MSSRLLSTCGATLSTSRSDGPGRPVLAAQLAGWQHVDPRHATIDRDDVHYAGTLHVEADLDLADALDLERALAHGAATQKALGSELSLNARRAKALGDLARTQTALDLFTQGHTGTPSGARDQAGLPLAREVVLHAHFTATADGQTTVFRRPSPGCSCGPAPTDTGSDATAPAPPRWIHPTQADLGSRHPADHDPAPHPATHPWRGHRHVCA